MENKSKFNILFLFFLIINLHFALADNTTNETNTSSEINISDKYKVQQTLLDEKQGNKAIIKSKEILNTIKTTNWKWIIISVGVSTISFIALAMIWKKKRKTRLRQIMPVKP